MGFGFDKHAGSRTFYAQREQAVQLAQLATKALELQAREEPGNPWLTVGQLVAHTRARDREQLRFVLGLLQKKGLVVKGVKPGQDAKLWALAAAVPG